MTTDGITPGAAVDTGSRRSDREHDAYQAAQYATRNLNGAVFGPPIATPRSNQLECKARPEKDEKKGGLLLEGRSAAREKRTFNSLDVGSNNSRASWARGRGRLLSNESRRSGSTEASSNLWSDADTSSSDELAAPLPSSWGKATGLQRIRKPLKLKSPCEPRGSRRRYRHEIPQGPQPVKILADKTVKRDWK